MIPAASDVFVSMASTPTTSPTDALETLAPSPAGSPVEVPTPSPTEAIIMVKGALFLEGMTMAGVTSNTLDALVSIIAGLCGVSRNHVHVSVDDNTDQRKRHLQDSEDGVNIIYEVEVPQALAGDVVSALDDPETITAEIMTTPDYSEVFAGFTGLQEVEAPTVVGGELDDSDSTNDSNDEGWWVWWSRFGISQWAGVGISGGVVVSAGVLVAFVIHKRRSNYGRKKSKSIFEMANPMGRDRGTSFGRKRTPTNEKGPHHLL